MNHSIHYSTKFLQPNTSFEVTLHDEQHQPHRFYTHFTDLKDCLTATGYVLQNIIRTLGHSDQEYEVEVAGQMLETFVRLWEVQQQGGGKEKGV